MAFERLLQPGRVGNLEIKNRMFAMPVGAPMADLNGYLTDDFIAYYEEKARGGAGAIITGVLVVDNETGVMEPNLAWLTDPNSIRLWKKFTDAIHKYDTKIFAQIYHPGKETRSSDIGGRTIIAPSEMVSKFGEKAHAMTVEEIHELTKKFAAAAALAKRADFDGVELHCAHGYLLCDFLSPSANQRTDEYGGSFENRVRFPGEIIAAIREACGRDFPLSVRISGSEFTEGGITPEESIRIAQYFESCGVDMINVSAGNQKTSHLNREPASFRQGWKKQLAAGIKKAVSIPVLAVNTIKRPEFAESLLEEGVSDFVGLARGFLADPHFAEKVRTGHTDEIRNCIGCLVCFETLIERKRICCTANPTLMREREFAHMERDGAGRKVVVIGGGPGGMEAARVLALRGFDVTLYEKDAELGGQMNYADKPPMKEKITWLRNAIAAQLKSAGVKVVLNCEVTPEMVETMDAEGAFLCCGASPIIPQSIPGVHGDNVCTIPELLSGKKSVDGKRVVVAGAGLTGLETGVFLASRGCRVTFVDMLDTIGQGIYIQTLNDVLSELEKYHGGKPDMYPSHKLISIQPDGITVEDKDGKQFDIAADAVVMSLGTRPRTELHEALRKRFGRLILTGDAVTRGRIVDATRDGFTKAWVFEP